MNTTESVSMARTLGGALLVAGTCIGAGMLGLPATTAAAGLYYTTFSFFGCWIMMTLTAFLMLEVTLWYKGETNLISMAGDALGKPGKYFAWLTYVLFLYALMSAYTSGGASMIHLLLDDTGLSIQTCIIGFVLFFALFIYQGTHWVDILNRLLVLGLVVAYVSLVYLVSPKIGFDHFFDGEVEFLWIAMPLLVTTFGFHLLIPSLKTYLKGNVNQLRLAIFLGSLLTLVIYSIWELIVLDIIPTKGADGLIAIYHHGQPATEVIGGLENILKDKSISNFAKLFSFFALVSSFIGVALGLFDFFADGLHIQKNKLGKVWLALLTFVPPSFIAYFYPQGFIAALTYAGVFAAILLVLYPACMAWAGRYQHQFDASYRVWGGKPLLILVIVFGLSVIGLHLANQFKYLPIPQP